jgi:hypothetical protein
LFRLAIQRFFLPPTRSAQRVILRLIREYAELEPLSSAMLQQLRQVGQNSRYHQMMYSRDSTPITFSLFDSFPEFRTMSRVLHSYEAP